MKYGAVVLAGGFGTRLLPVVPDVPKPMAPIRGVPFLEFVLHHLSRQGVRRVVLSVGYRHEAIQHHFGSSFASMSLQYAVEEEPLGTGGGIRKALNICGDEHVFVLNGDTYFDSDLQRLYAFHLENQALVSLSLKKMNPAIRYGTVRMEGPRILSFQSRGTLSEGLINAGVYCVCRDLFHRIPMPDVFSFEKDFLEVRVSLPGIYGLEQEGYFIDIGVPDDYLRAQNELM